jgi:hypothetical protein
MEEEFLTALRSLERQPFVNYVTVVDRNGYSIAASGDTRRGLAAHVREVHNCVETLFPDAGNIKIVVEGTEKSVVIGNRGNFLVGVQVTKDLF